LALALEIYFFYINRKYLIKASIWKKYFMKAYLLSLTLIVIFGIPTICQNCPTFQKIHPPYNTFGFKSVWNGSGTLINTLFIQEPKGEAFRSSDGGLHWKEIGCGDPLSQSNDCGCIINACYNSISFERIPNYFFPWCQQITYGVAVCDGGKLKQSVDLGDTWSNFQVSAWFQMPNIDIVKCRYDNGHFEAVGKSGFYTYLKMPCGATAASGYMQIFDSTRNFLNLSKKGPPTAVCGENGLLGIANGPQPPVFIFTNTIENLNAVLMMPDCSTIVAVGMNGTIVVYDGTNSLLYQNKNLVNVDLYGIAQAPVSQLIYVVGSGGVIYRFKICGSIITPMGFCNSGTSETLRDIDINSDDNNNDIIYIVGDNSIILKGQ